MAIRPVTMEIGSGNIRGSFAFGKREDYTYNVPSGAINVYINHEDNSSNTLNLGGGNGEVTLKWTKGDDKAYVHAWVNGALGAPNEIRWTIYATLLM